MLLLPLILLLVVAGVCLYLVPMDDKVKNIIYVLIVLGVVLWILTAFGVISPNSFKFQ